MSVSIPAVSPVVAPLAQAPTPASVSAPSAPAEAPAARPTTVTQSPRAAGPSIAAPRALVVERARAATRPADLESAQRVVEYLGYAQRRNADVWPGYAWSGPIVLSRAGDGRRDRGYHLVVNVRSPGPGYQLVDAAHGIYRKEGEVPGISGFAFRSFLGGRAALFDLQDMPPTEFANFALHETFHQHQDRMREPPAQSPAITESLNVDNGAAIRLELDVLRRYAQGSLSADEALRDMAALRWYRARHFPASLAADQYMEAVEGTPTFLEWRLLTARDRPEEIRQWTNAKIESVGLLMGNMPGADDPERAQAENGALQLLLRDKSYFVGAMLARMAFERSGRVEPALYEKTPWGALREHVSMGEDELRARFERLWASPLREQVAASARELSGAYQRDVDSARELVDRARLRLAIPEADTGASDIGRTVYLDGGRELDVTTYEAGTRGFRVALDNEAMLGTRLTDYRLQLLPREVTVSIDGGPPRPMRDLQHIRFQRRLAIAGEGLRIEMTGAGSVRRGADNTWITEPPQSSPLARRMRQASRDLTRPGWLARLEAELFRPVATRPASH